MRIEKPPVRPIPDAAYWKQLRQAYFACKAKPHEEHDMELQEAFDESSKLAGCLVDFEVKQGDYGRGLFSGQTIPKGTAVWTCDRYGIFRTRREWDNFLSSLPPFMQHDVVTWAYVMEWEKGVQVVGLDLEPASLMNHGGSDDVSDIEDGDDEVYADPKPANLECVEIPDSDDEWHYIAVTDIEPGEEFLCDYSKFHVRRHKLHWYDEAWDFIVEEKKYYPINCVTKLLKRLGWFE